MNLFRFTTVATSAAITPPPPPPPEFIRGGRLRKTSKGLISFAPFLAGASALALGALLATASPVEAGMCELDQSRGPINPTNGHHILCTGAASSDGTYTATASIANTALSVTDDATFGLEVASGKGLVVTTGLTTTDVSVDLDGNVEAEGNALEIDMDGTGATTVTMDGTLTSTAGVGLLANVASRATGAVMITTSAITSNGNGIEVANGGSGATTITTRTGSVVTSSASSGMHYAIRAVVDQNILAFGSSSQIMTITVNGDIGTSSSDSRGGIFASHSGIGNLNVTVNGDVFSGLMGVNAEHTNRGDTSVTINGAVNGGTHGVRVAHTELDTQANFANRTTTVALNNNVEGDVGLLVNIRDAGNSSMITVGRTDGTAVTVTGTDGTAVDLDGAGSQNFILRNGATLVGGIDASGATGGTTLDISGAVSPTSGNALEFGGAGSHTVILREGASISRRIEKISGATGNVEFRIEGDITGNPLNWINTFDEASRPGLNTLQGFDAGDSIIIVAGARAEFAEGTSLNDIPVNLYGRLVFSGASDNRQVTFSNFIGRGGEIDMDLDFSRGDRERARPRFSLGNLSNSTMSVPVNIRAVGVLRSLLNENGEVDVAYDTDGDGAITIGNVIGNFTIGTLGKDHFVRGVWLDNGVDDGDWELRLVCIGCDDPLVPPRWDVVATPRQQNRPGTGGGPGGPVVLAGPATLFDTLPMVLAHLGQPESMHRRTQNRSFQPSTGVWGKVQTRRLSVEPSAASFESDIHNVTFGVQAPIHTVMLGADVTLQTAETEAVIADGKQDIETNALIAGLAATWERDDLYVDGQFQYARFDNDLNAADGTKLASPTTDSFSAGVEVGYVLDAGNLKLGKWLGRGVLSNILVTPSAQVSWSQIGFSDFVAADGKTVSLDDGTVINGRVGIVAETLWESVVLHEAFAPASVRLQGSADVVVPLDGEVVTQVDGANQLSELEDPVLDVGIGVFYTWELGSHAYTLSGDISSRQGSEVEGYEGSLGFKYRF